MIHTKPPHKPFTKKFWILLSSSVLSLLLVYGGIVWAIKIFTPAPECSGSLAKNCIVIGQKGSVKDSQGTPADIRTTPKLEPKESAKSNADDTSSNLWRKRLVITNADPTRNYFIPLRTEREIVSAYKATLPLKNKISPYFVVNLQFVNRLRSSRIFITYSSSQKTTDPEGGRINVVFL